MSSESGKSSKTLLFAAVIVLIILLLSFVASSIQSDFGNVHVEIVELHQDDGAQLVGKLYTPDSATSTSPASAVLLLHGLNNDKDTEAPLAIELSRRGMVVLALDELSHGDSDAGGSVLEGGGDLGGIAAFDYLSSLPYVIPTNIGLVGHSMGGFSANATAQARPAHKAIAFQAFGPLNLSVVPWFHNYLQIWDRFEESSPLSRDDWIAQGETTIKYNLELKGFTPSNPVYDTTYGSFTALSAQRYALTYSTHPGGTWKSTSIKEVVAWMLQSLDGADATTAYSDASSQIFQFKELTMLLCVILSLVALVFVIYSLLDLEIFAEIVQKRPEIVYYEGSRWWRIATLNALIGGVTFVFFPFVGVLLFGAINSIVPIFNLLIGNAFLFWFLLNAVIADILVRRWRKRQGTLNGDDLGSISRDNPRRWQIIAKSLAIAIIGFIFLYTLAFVTQTLFTVELRYMWSFFRVLRPERFLTFILYSFFISYFFLVNGGIFLFGQARPTIDDSKKGIIYWWLLNVYNMLSVIILVFIIEYVPMFLLGTGPLLGGILGIFWLLGIFLMQIIPEFLLIFLIMTILFRKTGRYYVGSFLATLLVAWVMSNGAFL